jgi:hypothetical protein
MSPLGHEIVASSTAKALGPDIPQLVLLRADQLVEWSSASARNAWIVVMTRTAPRVSANPLDGPKQ